MIKYKTGGYHKEIEAVEIEKESEKSVWINGRTQLKHTSYHNYFDTWQQGKDFLVKEAQQKVDLCAKRLEYSQEKQAELLEKLDTEEKENEN